MMREEKILLGIFIAGLTVFILFMAFPKSEITVSELSQQKIISCIVDYAELKDIPMPANLYYLNLNVSLNSIRDIYFMKYPQSRYHAEYFLNSIVERCKNE